MQQLHGVAQGFSIIFPCWPQRAEDSSKIDVWGPNDHHFPMYFYVYWSWQRAKQVWSAGRIWPTGRHLRRPGVVHVNWHMFTASHMAHSKEKQFCMFLSLPQCCIQHDVLYPMMWHIYANPWNLNAKFEFLRQFASRCNIFFSKKVAYFKIR